MRYVDYFERKYTMIGRNTGQIERLRDMPQTKFGDLPPWADERLGNATRDNLTRWSHAILSMSFLEEVLAC